MIAFIGFCLLTLIFTAYVLSDGYGLGAAAIAPFLGKTRAENDAIIESVGPYWSRNEVWIAIAGGTLFAFFPRAYAAGFSLFYLPLVFVLWLLMGRGMAVELRSHLPSAPWKDFCSAVAAISSVGLMLLWGIALGNLVRGIPLNSSGFSLGALAMLLNPYAVLVGVTALIFLIEHGLTFIASHVEGDLAARAVRYAAKLWGLLLVAYLAVTIATVFVHPAGRLGIPIAILAGVVALWFLFRLRLSLTQGKPTSAFHNSLKFLACMTVAGASTMFPYIIPALGKSGNGLSAFETVSPSPTITATAISGIVAIALALLYGRRVQKSLNMTRQHAENLEEAA